MEIYRIEVMPLGTNCYLVYDGDTKEGIVVDPGGSPELIGNAIDKIGVKVVAIVDTHGHWDHIGANTEIKEKTNAKILIIEQFLLPVEDKAYFRADLNGKIDITRALAREFADYYIPLDGIMAKACGGEDMYHWSADGVHPNDNGSEFIGRVYADAINEMLK